MLLYAAETIPKLKTRNAQSKGSAIANAPQDSNSQQKKKKK